MEQTTETLPVARRTRHDGWTAERQRIFLAALAETGCVSRAAEAAGITPRSAYRLRRDPRGAAFAAAWDTALRCATHTLTAHAFERALRGGVREYWKNGELVGEIRQPSDNLLKFLLQNLAPDRFGPPGRFARSDRRAQYAGHALDGQLDGLQDSAVAADPLMASDYEPDPISRIEGPPRPPGADAAEDIDGEILLPPAYHRAAARAGQRTADADHEDADDEDDGSDA